MCVFPFLCVLLVCFFLRLFNWFVCLLVGWFFCVVVCFLCRVFVVGIRGEV